MLYYSAVRLKVTRSLFGGKYRHFFVAYTLCLSSFQVIMCREMRKLNVWCEETCSVQSLAIWLLFNKVPFDHLSLHLYPFVIAAIDWLLEPRACGKVCPANKWANLLQHQEKKTKKQTKKKKKNMPFLLIMACLTVKPSSFTHSRGLVSTCLTLSCGCWSIHHKGSLWRRPFVSAERVRIKGERGKRTQELEGPHQDLDERMPDSSKGHR